MMLISKIVKTMLMITLMELQLCVRQLSLIKQVLLTQKQLIHFVQEKRVLLTKYNVTKEKILHLINVMINQLLLVIIITQKWILVV